MAPMCKQGCCSNRQNRLYNKSASLRCDGKLFDSLGPAAAKCLMCLLPESSQTTNRVLQYNLVSVLSTGLCWTSNSFVYHHSLANTTQQTAAAATTTTTTMIFL